MINSGHPTKQNVDLESKCKSFLIFTTFCEFLNRAFLEMQIHGFCVFGAQMYNLTFIDPLKANALRTSLFVSSRNSHRCALVPMESRQEESPRWEPRASWQARDTAKESLSPETALLAIVVASTVVSEIQNRFDTAIMARESGLQLTR